MPPPKKIDPRIPVIAEIKGSSPPSSVREAFTRAGFGSQMLGVDNEVIGWGWSGKRLGELDLASLEFIQRVMARSTHIETNP